MWVGLGEVGGSETGGTDPTGVGEVVTLNRESIHVSSPPVSSSAGCFTPPAVTVTSRHPVAVKTSGPVLVWKVSVVTVVVGGQP